MSTILTATGLTMRFGGLTAVTEFDTNIPVSDGGLTVTLQFGGRPASEP